MENQRIFAMPFSSVYPLLVKKAERKGRAQAEVDTIICWLTGYNQSTLCQQIESNKSYEMFFNEAPAFNPNASKITGSICGYRVEEITDKLMWKIRCLDKLIDELAKGKPMEKILKE
ncbi:MAG: DUF2200 domain-containing protein [Treponema sp.]|jgi:hypothetical protein|nr:DUF2200 domain-containing protein [Treponema sp.]